MPDWNRLQGSPGPAFLDDNLNVMAQHPVKMSLKTDQCRGVCYSWQIISMSTYPHGEKFSSGFHLVSP